MMTQYGARLFIAIAGVAAFLFACFFIYQAASTNSVLRTTSSKKIEHTPESNGPFSVIAGTTVRIEPYNATFEVPGDWLSLKPAPDSHVKNLFLSMQDLNEVNLIDLEANGFDSEGADVINSVLPFENCAAHVGDRGWGNGLWNDLQVRVYISDFTSNEVAARVERQGLEKASEVFERASLKQGRRGDWQKSTLDILDAPSWSDLILNQELDFYYRSFGKKTVVFVFLHTNGFEKEISLLLDSFNWPHQYVEP